MILQRLSQLHHLSLLLILTLTIQASANSIKQLTLLTTVATHLHFLAFFLDATAVLTLAVLTHTDSINHAAVLAVAALLPAVPIVTTAAIAVTITVLANALAVHHLAPAAVAITPSTVISFAAAAITLAILANT